LKIGNSLDRWGISKALAIVTYFEEVLNAGITIGVATWQHSRHKFINVPVVKVNTALHLLLKNKIKILYFMIIFLEDSLQIKVPKF